MKTTLQKLTCCSIITTLSFNVSLATGAEDFSKVYEHDSAWPQYVSPTQQIIFDNGTALSPNIPVVLSRAYEDGSLAVTDRIGSVLIDHKETDFLQQVSQQTNHDETEQNFHNFIRQIGRRVFDLSHSETKAVPEAALSEYDTFLVCKSSMQGDAIKDLVVNLNAQQDWLAAHNCRPIIVFEAIVKNAEFYSFLKTHEIHYPVVVPIFTKGFLEFTYTQREAGASKIWLNKNGKLLAKGNHLEAMLK